MRRRKRSADDAYKRRFPRPVRTDETHDLTGACGERKIAQNDVTIIRSSNILDGELQSNLSIPLEERGAFRAPQQVEEKRRARDRGDDAERQFLGSDDRAGEQIGEHQESRAPQRRERQQAPMIVPDEESRRMRDNQSNKSN